MKKIYLTVTLTFIFILLCGCSVARNPNEAVKPETSIIEVKQEEKQDVIVQQEAEEKQEIKEPEQIKPTLKSEEKEKAEEMVEEKPIIKVDIPTIDNKVLIASGETNFNPNQIERSSNIRLAASYINGLVLYPGDEFSFNNVVGKRTKERGFLPADVIVGGNYTKGYGGGVCQTSSTLCIAVRKTDMKILEQNPHSKRSTYTTIENEAMINYGTSDFRFVNTYDKPVTIEMSFEISGDREIIKSDIYLLEQVLNEYD